MMEAARPTKYEKENTGYKTLFWIRVSKRSEHAVSNDVFVLCESVLHLGFG
jgi:hypothetical protein